MGSNRIEISQFDGKIDFQSWKKKMRALLPHYKVVHALEPDLERWPKELIIKKQEIDDEAYNLLILNLANSVLRKVDDATTAIQVWNKLETLYSLPSVTNIAFVKCSLFAFRLDLNKSIDDNVDELLKLNLLLKGAEHEVDSTSLAVILLNVVSDDYMVVKNSVQYTGITPSFDLVVSGLKARELELKLRKNSSSGLFVKPRLDNQNFSKHQNPFKGKKKNKNTFKPKETRKYFHCNKPGHLRKNCYSRLKKQKQLSTENPQSINKNNVSEVLVSSVHRNCHEWIVDSGCSFHMCPYKEWFTDYQVVKAASVFMGNDNVCTIHGIGSVSLTLDNGNVILLTNVRHIPELKRNLISVGVLDDMGCENMIKSGCLEIIRNGKIIARAKKKNSLYVLCGRYSGLTNIAASVTDSQAAAIKWHLRLGHMSQKGMKVLEKSGQLGKSALSPLDFCEVCVLGKQHRICFNTGTHLSKSKLDYVHADLWGPERICTHGNCRYFLSIVDDYSRKVWTYLLRSKDETFGKFKDWKTLVEKQTGNSVKVLRTDRGLEFCNEDFDRFCSDSGILRHRTVRLTPQQNGVAERMNRTILEKVRCLLFTSGLSKPFWGEALNTTVYLINRSPSTAIELKSPKEKWTGKVPNLDHIRIFGCSAYAHTRDGKLDPRSIKCIFLGYEPGTKGYRLWDRQSSGIKIIISRDVVFDETCFPCKTSDQTDPMNTSLSEDNKREEPANTTQFEVEHQPNLNQSTETEPIPNLETEEESVEDLEQNQVESLDSYQLAKDRTRRVIRPPTRYSYADLVFTALISVQETKTPEPTSFETTSMSKDRDKWLNAMLDEINSLHVNNTWTLVPKPANHKLVDCKWLFKIKEGDRILDPPRYKARLVAKGFTQCEGIDFNEIFSPVVKFKTIRIMLAAVTQLDLELEQLDVKTAFLHGNLEEKIYMKQPPGFIDKSHPDYVCLLNKSLYGLKQSPRQWNKRFDTFICSIGFKKSNFDACLYYLFEGNDSVFVLLYVDDMLLISNSMHRINMLKRELSSEFDMKDLGSAKRILGMHIDRNRKQGCLRLHRKPYLDSVLNKFNMKNCKGVNLPIASHFILSKEQCPKSTIDLLKMENVPYANGIGSIMYAMISTRPDLSFAISLLSRFMSNPGMEHWNALKWTLKYLNSIVDVGLHYSKCDVDKFSLYGFVDSDFAGNRDNRRSTTAYYYMLGNCCVSWKSQMQSIVSLSSTEAEYVALCDALKEAIWLQGLLFEINLVDNCATVYCDSQSAIHLSKNPIFHDRTKHIEVKYHFVREKVMNHVVNLQKVKTEENAADFGTKVVTVSKFRHCLNLLNIN